MSSLLSGLVAVKVSTSGSLYGRAAVKVTTHECLSNGSNSSGGDRPALLLVAAATPGCHCSAVSLLPCMRRCSVSSLAPKFTRSENAGCRCASIDGDGDRLVYFSPRPDGGGLLLLDGDRIATLAALTVQQLLAELPAGQPAVSVNGMWPSSSAI
jgi:hypothetical protein